MPDRRIFALGEVALLLKWLPNHTVRRWRPLARRRLITFWPSAVLMRFRKPWHVFRLLRFGWYVRFMVAAPCGLAKRVFYVPSDPMSSPWLLPGAFCLIGLADRFSTRLCLWFLGCRPTGLPPDSHRLLNPPWIRYIGVPPVWAGGVCPTEGNSSWCGCY
jgi:hypothetical protein